MTIHERLKDLAYNLRWDWHRPTKELFRELDPGLWETVGHNPVALLRRLDPDAVAGREGIDDRVQGLWEDLDAYLHRDETWYGRDFDRPLVAYFSAEYGITESLRIYSGGLGVLAGDHLKSASDLGVPLVAMGLLYRQGYFRQELNPEGRQRESYPVADFHDLPLRAVGRPDGSPLRLRVPFPGRQVAVRVWRADVGRIPLYLLDTDIPENGAEDRRLTSRLYGGDQTMRIAQEILLGMGGFRALREMRVQPRSYHMNEGHSAFLGLELVRERMQEEDRTLDDAMEAVRREGVFTTHTPVPAGHDRFPAELMERFLTPAAASLGLDMPGLMDLGRVNPGAEDEPFTMTVLALRLADQVNGVSALHGAVTRRMWKELWPHRKVHDVPIGHITNGVHLPSWVHPEIADAYGVAPGDLGLDDRRPEPDPRRLWDVRQRRREELVSYVARVTGARFNPGALTIAFARRFATYKRATLLLSDLDRLAALLADPGRPVQILFAGKAHPRDEGGKALIRRIVEVSRDPRFRDRLTFIPGYGIDVARQLVQGADVWLNNPRRPMEASGTSGMKAAANGVLNVSILDGWWDEAWQSSLREDAAPIGWAIGEGAEAATPEAADARDLEALYSVLKGEVVPTFYDRGADGFPAAWADRMVQSIRQVAPVFTTHRMVRDYVERYRRAAEAAGAATPG
jgi:starch phosphorylase